MDTNSEKTIRQAAGREETTETNPNQMKPTAGNPEVADLFDDSSDDDGDNTKEVMIMKDHGQRETQQPNNSRRSPRVARSQTVRQRALEELVKRRRKSAAAAGTDSDRRRSSGKSESSSGSDRVEKSVDEEIDDYSSSSHHEYDESMIPATFGDIRKITVTRSTLENWFREPFFDELIAGCYVRIGIGRSRDNAPVYRLCCVRNVDATNPDRSYRFGNRSTCKFLNVVWGSERSAARWKMVMASDSPPLREEFDQLFGEINRNGGSLPSKHEVHEKKKEIEKAKSFVYSAAMVKMMLEEKKSSGSKPRNIAAEKTCLRVELENVKDDGPKAKRIKARLSELEAVCTIDMKGMRLQEMNKKNKVENLTSASKPSSFMSEGQSRSEEPDADLFSRIWTRSRNYYSSTTEPLKGETNEGEKRGALATETAMEEAKKAGKLVDDGRLVSTHQYKLHDFDLPISLAALHKFGGATRDGFTAGYMARKQWNEAKYGAQVPEKTFDKGNQRGQVLSIEEYYKRRRGLL